MRRQLFVVLMVLVVAVAGAAVAADYLFRPGGTSSPRVIDDGPTFYQALATLNASVATVSGGPWNFSAAYGVASPIPVDPASWGYEEYDKAFASCQSDFNGQTLWNGSFPTFNGTFNSGTAPFWQAIYYSNASQSLLIGTDVEGQIHVYPPISYAAPCAKYTGLAYQPWLSQVFYREYGFPGNTPLMASDAWNTLANSWVGWVDRPVAEMYLFGGDQFGSGQAYGATQVQFFTCGTPGAAGATPGLAVYGSSVQSPSLGDNVNYTLGCTPTTDNFTPISLGMLFSNATVGYGPGTDTYTRSFTFNFTGPSGYTGPGYNTGGVTSSLIRLTLTAANGSTLPTAAPACPSWVASASECLAASAGWYAILEYPSGQWAGAYGSFSPGPGWNYPATPVLNNESIEVVVPAGWDDVGYQLSISATVSALPLTAVTPLD